MAALVEDFHLSAAVKALNPDPLAPVDDKSDQAMQDRHPVSPPPVLREIAADVATHTVTHQRVLECVREFKTTSAGAMSGLRPAHLRFFLVSTSWPE